MTRRAILCSHTEGDGWRLTAGITRCAIGVAPSSVGALLARAGRAFLAEHQRVGQAVHILSSDEQGEAIP
jgi:hypothetical protein